MKVHTYRTLALCGYKPFSANSLIELKCQHSLCINAVYTKCNNLHSILYNAHVLYFGYVCVTADTGVTNGDENFLKPESSVTVYSGH